MMSSMSHMAQSGPNPLAALFGTQAVQDNKWGVLNGELMDKIYRLYLGSGMVRTILKRLSQEVLRGGVYVREVYGGNERPATSLSGGSARSAVELTPAEQNHIEAMLERAIMYGHLYGMVPMMNVDLVLEEGDEETHEGAFDSVGAGLGALEIPLPTSGHFVSRTDRYGRTEVGWRWRSQRTGRGEAHPSKGVWVFIWNDQVPNPGNAAPFNSSIIPVFNDLMRLNDLIRMDTQAYYEMTHPPMVVQEHPRQSRDTADQQVYEFATKHFITDPEGDDMAGLGPGGTLIGAEHMMAGADAGRETRMNRNVQAAMRSRQRSVQTRIDATTGKIYCENHTLLYERGYFPVPAGLNVTSSYPRPTLRNDLLDHIEHTYRHIAITFGVPPIFINSGSTDISGVRKTSSVGNSDSTASGNAMMHADASAENMRKTVVAARAELAAMYAQAYHHLVWNAERYTISQRLARSEREIQDVYQQCSETMKRIVELMGDQLATAFREQEAEKLRETREVQRIVEISQEAIALFHDAQLRQRSEALLALIAEAGRKLPGEMTVDEVAERQQRGEGMVPVDESMLADPEGLRQGLLACPEEKKRKKPIDPNELSEQPREIDDDRPAYTTNPNGPNTYQRVKLQTVPPSIIDAIDKATEIIERRRGIEGEAGRLDVLRAKLSPATGRRGDTKIEMVFKSLPVPNWPMLRHLVLDGILDPERYKEMVMSDLGLDPVRDGPGKGVKPLEAALAAAAPSEPARPEKPEAKKRKDPEKAEEAVGGGDGEREKKRQKEKSAE